MKPITFFGLALVILSQVAMFLWTVVGVRETSAGGQVRSIEYKPVAVGQLAPDFEAEDIHKSPVVLSKIGKVKIVNFWASWCGPCLQEMPSMAELAKQRGQEIEIIAVSCDESEKDYRKALNLVPGFRDSSIRIVFDPSKKLMSAYGVTGLPESFVIGADGKLIRKIVGSLDWLKLPDGFFNTP